MVPSFTPGESVNTPDLVLNFFFFWVDVLVHLCLYFVCIRSVYKRCPKLVCKLTKSTILLVRLGQSVCNMLV
ncbi:hypothetical protein HanPSC8_Chr17g0757791 [Helianthus annuus]|nr:hypothetical protein HanPSC8_Chr17g0757791 [Helianthus annuus]